MTAIILTLGGVFFILLLVAEWHNKRSKVIHQQQRSLQLLSKLQNLIALLQKHRGINAAFLRGESNALPPLGNLRSKISLKTTFLTNQPNIKNQDRWLGFIDHWQRFQEKSHQMSVTNSFEQHTNMIANLLLLYEYIAETEKFNHKTFRKPPNLSILWREFPILIEYMGQVRAIGVGVILDGNCSQVEKLKLSSLVTEIPQLSKSVFLHLRENGNQTTTQQALLQQASESCARLTHTVQRQLIEGKKINLDIESYYAQASQAMEKSAHLLTYEMGHLAQALKSS